MIIHNIKWKDYFFTINPGESFRNRILLQKVDIKPVKTEVNKVKPAMKHGIFSGYTLLRERLINIEGFINADNEETRDNLIKKLDNLFLPAIDFGPDNTGIYPLYFSDANGNEFFINCKVIELPEYTEEAGNRNMIWFKLSLLADDPYIYGKDLIITEDINRTQGITLETELSTSFAYNSYLTLNYGGAIKAPLNAKITAITDNATDGYVRFINLTTGKLFKVAVELNNGDILEIDTKNNLVLKNGVDISSGIDLTSDWIYLDLSENGVVVDTGKDYHTCDVEYSFRNLWI